MHETLKRETTPEDAHDLRLPRKEVLENLQLKIGRAMVARPDPEVMDMVIRESEGRVHQFPTRDVSSGSSVDSIDTMFHRGTLVPLCEDLQKTYGNKPIALRAIMTSVNGTREGALSVGGSSANILDVTEVLSKGSENNASSFNVLVMYADGTPDEAADSLKYIGMYANSTEMRFSINEKDRAAVFPGVIVYDATLLEATGTDRFTARPKDGVDGAEIILGVYVLDRIESVESSARTGMSFLDDELL